jgi:hypothetical protein
MTSEDIERTHRIARDLVELLSAYEQELLRLGAEGQTSAGQLRCALGAAVAQACDLISDKAAGGDLPARFAEARSWRP